MQLSVVIAVFNERTTIKLLLEKVDAVDVDKEVIIVDDGSTDGTCTILRSIGQHHRRIVLHDRNQGKGAALRTGLAHVSGDYVIIQDADLEYNPQDYVTLLAEAERQEADVVYGSRFTGKRPVMAFKNFVANRLLTALTNLLYSSSLTDMETCYKLMRRELVLDLHLESDGFNVEPELTAKILKRGVKIFEVPVSYAARPYSKGKKISWVDFVEAVWTLVRLRLEASNPTES